MMLKYAIALAILLILALVFTWAFLPARYLPGNRARHLRIRLHLRLHPGKGFAHVFGLWLRWGRLAVLRRSGTSHAHDNPSPDRGHRPGSDTLNCTIPPSGRKGAPEWTFCTPVRVQDSPIGLLGQDRLGGRDRPDVGGRVARLQDGTQGWHTADLPSPGPVRGRQSPE